MVALRDHKENLRIFFQRIRFSLEFDFKDSIHPLNSWKFNHTAKGLSCNLINMKQFD